MPRVFLPNFARKVFLLGQRANSPKRMITVTADHETGGLTLPGGNIKDGTMQAIFTTTNHTGVMVPIFAYGPGADKFAGIMENQDIYPKILQIMGWEK